MFDLIFVFFSTMTLCQWYVSSNFIHLTQGCGHYHIIIDIINTTELIGDIVVNIIEFTVSCFRYSG